MNKKEYLDEIEQKKLVDTYERKNVLKSIGGALKSGISAVGKKVLPFVLSVPLFLGAAFGFAGCDTQDVVKEEPGITVPGGDIGEEPGTPGIEEPGKEEPGTDEPGKEEPGMEDPTNPGGSTEEPGKEEPGTEEPENPGGSTEEPTNPGEIPEDPEQDISNLVVYVDEEGESHVNMPVLQEVTFDYLDETPFLNQTFYEQLCSVSHDDILFTNYSPTTSKLTFFGKGIFSSSQNNGYFSMTLNMDLGEAELSVDNYKNMLPKPIDWEEVEVNTFSSEYDSLNIGNVNTEEQEDFLDALVSILDHNGKIDKDNIKFATLTRIEQNSGSYGFGYGRNINGYIIEKSGEELILKNYSIYSSSQSGEQVEEDVNKYITNILNYDDNIKEDKATYVVVNSCTNYSLGLVEGYYYNDDEGVSLIIDDPIKDKEEIQSTVKNTALPSKKKEIELSL